MFQGSFAALVTPFKNGSLDEEALRGLVGWHIQSGTHGLVPCGTTGESPALSHEEHRRVVQIVVEEAKNRVPVIAGSASNSTAKTVSMVKEMEELGANALLVVVPYYNRPIQEGLYQHFKAVAASVRIPIIIYNIPSRCGVNMLPETIVRVAKDCQNILGVKEASGSLDQVSEIVRHSKDNFSVLSGDDSLTLPMLSVGAKGVISVVANVLPRETAELTNAWHRGDLVKARERHHELLPLIKSLFLETNPIPVKAAMGMLGLCGEELRLPMTPLSAANREKLREELKKWSPLKN